jgi:hypothetical protein
MYSCPIEYDPGRDYIRQEMVALIKVHRNLLCFFAQMSGAYVLGLDFTAYDAVEGSVSVYMINREQVRILLAEEGPKFKRAYRSSGLGKAILVTFTSEAGRGWVKLYWALSEDQIRRF